MSRVIQTPPSMADLAEAFKLIESDEPRFLDCAIIVKDTKYHTVKTYSAPTSFLRQIGVDEDFEDKVIRAIDSGTFFKQRYRISYEDSEHE